MEPTRLTMQIVKFYENRGRAKTKAIKWILALKDEPKSAFLPKIQDLQQIT